MTKTKGRTTKSTKNKTVKAKSEKTFVYNDTHYQSNDGMLTSVWGPSTWHLLHTMSFNYPVKPTCDDKSNYMNFILSLKTVLPCGKCRANLKKNFKKLPLRLKDMESRHTFSKYIYNLHEVINKMLGKKSGLTFEEVRERYEHFRARCKKTKEDLEKEAKEKGCTEPIYGFKSKCILKIVPNETKCETFQIENRDHR